MKRITMLVMTVLALSFVALPVTVKQVSPTVAAGIASFEVVENSAEAKSKRSFSFGGSKSKRSFSFGKSKSKPRKTVVKPRTTTKKSSSCSTSQNCSKSGSNGKLNTKQLFKKGDSTGKAKAKKAKAVASPMKKKSPSAKKPSTVAKVGSKKRPVLTKTRTKTVTANRTKSISAPQAKKTRLTANRTRAKTTMYARTRAQSRTMRSDRNYWRSERQYYRNRQWSSYNAYGWGYGYRPGWTYHSGWGGYGYGYTRGGLSVVDYMIIYSIFGHSNTASGDTVVNNTYIINGEESEVTAVPEGSRLTGFGSKKSLVIPAEDGDEIIEIPAGSTFTQTDSGMLITTPDGVAVLVPSSDAYKAEEGYAVPEEASAPMEYDALQEVSATSTDEPWYKVW